MAACLLDGLLQASLQADVVTYSAAMTAFSQGGQWERALLLMHSVRDEGMQPDLAAWP